MSKAIPAIRKYMTSTPHSIAGDETLAMAERVMREHDLRHLPVVDDGKLLGILSDRQIKFVETFPDVDPTTLTVEEAMTEEPYTVDPDTPLDDVVRTMASEKYGSAIVAQNGRVVGIFTTVDACRALAELLETRLKK